MARTIALSLTLYANWKKVCKIEIQREMQAKFYKKNSIKIYKKTSVFAIRFVIFPAFV